MNHRDLRDKDIAILQAIQNGAQNVSDIRQATTLTTREINYSINEYSLEQYGLVEIHRPEGREWQVINGQKRNIWKPKTLQLTDKATRTLTEIDREQDLYQELSRQQMIRRLVELEERQDRLENMFKNFRSKVMEQI